MIDSRITKFNYIVGNEPVGLEDREDFWKQIKLQAKLVLEEAQEMFDAANNEDLVEVIDGQADVWYLNEYVEDLLAEAGVHVKVAHGMVCDNNSSKYTTDLDFALESSIAQASNGVLCSVYQTMYYGEVYYVVKRDSDGKVVKLIGHQSPDIRSCIPNETFNTLKRI